MLGSELTTVEYIEKSLFASLFGNIAGALLVAVPFVYFWLWDYDASGLRAAEAGMIINRDSPNGGSDIGNERTDVKEV